MTRKHGKVNELMTELQIRTLFLSFLCSRLLFMLLSELIKGATGGN